MKRNLILIGAGILLIGLGFLLYFFFLSDKGGVSIAPGILLPGSGDANSGSGASSQTTQAVGVAAAGAGTEVAPHLIRISDESVVPGAGLVSISGTVASSTLTDATSVSGAEPDVAIMYIDKASGNVFDFRAHARTLTRISNKTLPGIHDAVWTPDASLAFVRFLERSGGTEKISTYALPRSGEGGYTLESGISQVLIPGKDSLLTFRPTANGSVGTLSSFLGTNVRTLFTSPLSQLHLSSGEGALIATTKASAKLDGYAFLINQKDGSFTRILGPLRGLSTQVSPKGRYVLYAYLDGTKLALAVFDTKNNSATRLPLSTLVEKCTWSSDDSYLYCAVPVALSGTFPDDWYQGAVHTSDRIWRISLADRVATQVIDPATVGAGAMDIVSLATDALNDVLVFTNRSNGSLWVYNL